MHCENIFLDFVFYNLCEDFHIETCRRSNRTILCRALARSDFILWSEYVQRFTSHYYHSHSSLRALYCPLVPFSVPWKRPSGIATAKHALKPTLVPAHRDQRYIILRSFCPPLTVFRFTRISNEK